MCCLKFASSVLSWLLLHSLSENAYPRMHGGPPSQVRVARGGCSTLPYLTRLGTVNGRYNTRHVVMGNTTYVRRMTHNSMTHNSTHQAIAAPEVDKFAVVKTEDARPRDGASSAGSCQLPRTTDHRPSNVGRGHVRKHPRLDVALRNALSAAATWGGARSALHHKS